MFKWERVAYPRKLQLSPITFPNHLRTLSSLVTKAKEGGANHFACNAVLQVFPSVVHVAVAPRPHGGGLADRPGEIRCTCLAAWVWLAHDLLALD